MSPPDAYAQAECRKISLKRLEKTFWFPGPTNVRVAPGPLAMHRWTQAKEVCHQCPLEYMCGEQFLGEMHGVWGGMDPHERELLRQKRTEARRKAAQAAREAVGWTQGAMDEAA